MQKSALKQPFSVYDHSLQIADSQRLDALYQKLAGETASFVGYPCNVRFDYSELYRFLGFSVNNLGDPFATSNFRINTHEFEREVLERFAEFFRAPKDQFWGYVTNGGTEGNMYGLYLARELHPQGIVYYSEDTHYSVAKIIHVLGVRSIMIRSRENGEMDTDDLRETIRIHRDAPPIVFANIGTTMKGAVDNIAEIKKLMRELAVPQYYLHSDAALSGMILPFVDKPQPFDFADGVDSISVSGHKLIGSPVPCGVVIAKKNNVQRIGRAIEYVGAMDTTINGSRNGIAPLFLWYALKRLGREGVKAIVDESLALAEYAIEAFGKKGIPAWRNENSITVVFPRPKEEVMKKWQIAPYREIAHIITLPHVTREVIDRLAEEIAQP
ncbi:MAG: histidine decarboxylase [Alphaproteobacteria bacterium]|nr:histidine decarboxylase [Alphaproteobacteria bacterium]